MTHERGPVVIPNRLPLSTREPVMVAGVATSLVAAVIALLVAFGVDLTDDQRTAILALVGVVASIVGPPIAAAIARRSVSPTAVIVEVVEPDGTVVAGEASPLPTGTPIAPPNAP